MSVIYEPSGKAREYSELACNLFTGCRHRCVYCYCPAILHQTLAAWSGNPRPRENILQLLDKEAAKMPGCSKEILFCFMSDPYQTEEAAHITRRALLICERHKFKKVNILTKAGMRAMDDFDIFGRNPGWKFGSTIVFKDESLRQQWEPSAPPIESRYTAVMDAFKRKIYTWVSVEPVIDPQEALQVMSDLKSYVNFWKVGKLNHFPEIEKTIDWGKFLADVRVMLNGSNYYIKKDLLAYER